MKDNGKNISNTNSVLVSIITVSYNSEKTIGRTIESVLNQTYDNIEYIIVDGNSKDDTVAIAESYRKQFDNKGITFTIISEPDKGMYDGLNKGAKLSRGELVGQINSDDWYEKNAVEIMSELYKKEHYDAAWGSITIVKRTGNIIKHARLGRLWTTTHWCHPAMFSRRELLLEHPYPMESMYDDFDFITAVHTSGGKIVTTDEIISNFSFGGMSTQKSLSEVRKRISITYSIYRKYGMSRLYWFHRVALEFAKYLMG